MLPEVKNARAKKNPLTFAGLKCLREVHTRELASLPADL